MVFFLLYKKWLCLILESTTIIYYDKKINKVGKAKSLQV